MKFIILFSVSLMLAACSHSSQKLTEGVSLTPSLKAQQYTNIYFAAQPPLEEFHILKSKGFATIINLRQAKEGSYSEKREQEVAKRAEFNYVHIPMSGKKPLTDEMVKKITEAVVAYRPKGKMLIHCSSGNRAALWAGGHFYLDHGYTKEDSLKVAKKLGLNHDATLGNLVNYLGTKE